MSIGTLYSIGVGPGDPGLMTIHGAELINKCNHIYIPTSKIQSESVARTIAQRYINPKSFIHEIHFPMDTDQQNLELCWTESATQIAVTLRRGDDACFLTLGDPLLYSTSIYLIRMVKKILPEAVIEVIPGVTSFCAVAALTHVPLGEAKNPLVIVPTSDNLSVISDAISLGGTVVLMKIGKRLQTILELLERLRCLDRAVFVSHAGMENQRIETDLATLRGTSSEAGYLSIILIEAVKK